MPLPWVETPCTRPGCSDRAQGWKVKGGQPSNLSTKPLPSSPSTPSHEKMCLCLPAFSYLNPWSPQLFACASLAALFCSYLGKWENRQRREKGLGRKGIPLVGVSGQMAAVVLRGDRDTRLRVGSPASIHIPPSQL